MFFLPTVSLNEQVRQERGETKLLLALLKRAVLDYFGADREEAQGAEEWIFDEDPTEREYSFAWVCDQLGLDGVKISDRLVHFRSTGQSERITRFLSKAR